MADSSSDHSQARTSAAEILAVRLRRLRTARGLTQRKMALALGLGAHSNIADYESGRRLPQNDILLAYERYFALPGTELQRLRFRALATRARANGQDGSATTRQPGHPLPRQPQLAPLARGDPRELGGFQLIGRLGRGTLGQSYLALTGHASPVVIKVAAPELATALQFRSRLSDRLNALQAISSPRVAGVIYADTDARQPWIALSYVPGPSIADIIGTHGPLPPPVVCALAQGIAEAVIGLHRAGLTQLPLSPAKIRLGAEGPVIIDSGICQAAAGLRHAGDAAPGVRPAPGSPEPINDPSTGPPADVFAIGAVLAYAVAGVRPSGGSHPGQLPAEPGQVEQHCQDDMLAELISSCLNSDPGLRPRPAQIIEALNPAREHTHQAAPPPPDADPPRTITRRRFRVPARPALALTGAGSAISVLAALSLTLLLPGHRHATPHTAVLADGPLPATAQAYDEYGCVGPHDVPPTVRLDPPGNPREAGWRSSTPQSWNTPYCTAQIWWVPYANNGANPLAQFSWTFRTSIPHPATCTAWAYYPPPPSGHSGSTALYSIYEGSMRTSTTVPLHLLARVTVDQSRYRGTWHRLGIYRISHGLIKITLDNTGYDPDPEHGPIAGPVHVSCS